MLWWLQRMIHDSCEMTISRTQRSMSSLMRIFELVQSRQAGVFHKPHLGALTFEEILSKLP